MRRIIALGVVGVVLALLVLAQLVLPGIAAQRLRDRLERSGQVLGVQVRAFPAIELLWHHADRVVVRMGRYRSSPGHIGGLLGQAADVGSLDASAREIDTGLLTLHNATLAKRGSELIGSAAVTEADLRRALPILQSVAPVASGDGQLILRGTATLLGVSVTIDATVSARNGELVVAPDVPLGGLATITVFADPHVDVQSVRAATTPGGFSVYARGQLH